MRSLGSLTKTALVHSLLVIISCASSIEYILSRFSPLFFIFGLSRSWCGQRRWVDTYRRWFEFINSYAEYSERNTTKESDLPSTNPIILRNISLQPDEPTFGIGKKINLYSSTTMAFIHSSFCMMMSLCLTVAGGKSAWLAFPVGVSKSRWTLLVSVLFVWYICCLDGLTGSSFHLVTFGRVTSKSNQKRSADERNKRAQRQLVLLILSSHPKHDDLKLDKPWTCSMAASLFAQNVYKETGSNWKRLRFRVHWQISTIREALSCKFESNYSLKLSIELSCFRVNSNSTLFDKR